MPRDNRSTKALLKAAIRDPNPVVFLENELLYGTKGEVSDDPDFVMEIGKGQILKEGDSITLVGFSKMLNLIEQAEVELAKLGISCEIIDPICLRPFDFDMIEKSVKKTNRILIVEESWPFAGIASEIMAQVNEKCFDYLDHEPVRVTGKDIPLPYAVNLEALALPCVQDIIDAALKMLGR